MEPNPNKNQKSKQDKRQSKQYNIDKNSSNKLKKNNGLPLKETFLPEEKKGEVKDKKNKIEEKSAKKEKKKESKKNNIINDSDTYNKKKEKVKDEQMEKDKKISDKKINNNSKGKAKMKYELKLKEVNEKENEVKSKKAKITVAEEKIKKLKNELSEDKKILDKEIVSFNKKVKEKEKELAEKEKLLKQREERLNKVKEFSVPPNSPPILIGLENIGATCYMNASLQCLSNTKNFTKFFLFDYKKEEKNIMANEYYRLIKKLWKKDNNNKPVKPTSFKEVLSKENSLFAGVTANDSKDFINFLIERLHQELNEPKVNKDNNNTNEIYINNINQSDEMGMLKLFFSDFEIKYNSIISNLFYGILESKSLCNICKDIKFNFQIYSFLEFHLQQVNLYFSNLGKRPLLINGNQNPDIDLYECLEYFSKVELMSGQNQMYCNRCKKECDSLYSTKLFSGPNYLIIYLNRGKGAVYECKVNFPEQLNLINYLGFQNGPIIYDLYAVVCHLGPSSMNGHFVAYCKNRIDNKWYLYNDAIVSLCTKSQQYNDGMPYILFYQAIIRNN